MSEVTIEPPEIVETEACEAAVVHVTVPLSAMPTEMPNAVGGVLAAVKAQGVGPAGPMFAYHLRRPAETFDFEVGFPVSAPIRAEGRVTASTRPAARAARTVYQGPYEGLHTAWAQFGEWFEARGLSAAGPLWETYAVGPESGADAKAWRTELYLPLAD